MDCVCVFVSHLFYRRGKDVDEGEVSSSHRLYRDRQAGLQLWDPLISATSGTQIHMRARVFP